MIMSIDWLFFGLFCKCYEAVRSFENDCQRLDSADRTFRICEES
jgi:hypothetical protein